MMKEEDVKYRQFLSLIKENPPVPENPDALTVDIMNRIGQLPQRKGTRRLLSISGWTSTVAAVFLIGFLISEMFFQPTGRIGYETGTIQEIWPSPVTRLSDTTGFSPEEIQEMEPAEKYTLLLPLIRERRESRTERMLLTRCFTNHLKDSPYENK